MAKEEVKKIRLDLCGKIVLCKGHGGTFYGLLSEGPEFICIMEDGSFPTDKIDDRCSRNMSDFLQTKEMSKLFLEQNPGSVVFTPRKRMGKELSEYFVKLGDDSLVREMGFGEYSRVMNLFINNKDRAWWRHLEELSGVPGIKDAKVIIPCGTYSDSIVIVEVEPYEDGSSFDLFSKVLFGDREVLWGLHMTVNPLAARKDMEKVGSVDGKRFLDIWMDRIYTAVVEDISDIQERVGELQFYPNQHGTDFVVMQGFSKCSSVKDMVSGAKEIRAIVLQKAARAGKKFYDDWKAGSNSLKCD